MADAAERGHQAADRTANPGRPRPVREPSSDNDSAEPIEMPAPTEADGRRGMRPTSLFVAKAAAKTGAELTRNRPSIPPIRAESPAAGISGAALYLGFPLSPSGDFVLERPCLFRVLHYLRTATSPSEFSEWKDVTWSFPHGAFIEAACFQFHHFGLLPDRCRWSEGGTARRV